MKTLNSTQKDYQYTYQEAKLILDWVKMMCNIEVKVNQIND